MIHSDGHYANAARAKRAREAAGARDAPSPAAAAAAASEPDSPERKAARKPWADLIRHVYETDPLICSRGGAAMKIIALITERKVILIQ
ncbi:MAG TPA: hypothetical protein VMT00_02375 [Thermoanaerobaculia bacterium]|nr:hypothetical protein [Thermoanaerobaculia bacterium]